MKRIGLIALFGIALVAAIVFWGRKYPVENRRSPELQHEFERKAAAFEAEENRVNALEKQLHQARTDVLESDRKTRALAATLATNSVSPTNGGGARPGSNPLQDPAMHRMTLQQQVQNMEKNIKRLVSPELQSKLNLNSEKSAQLRELLKRKGRPAVELLMSVMSGELDLDQAAIKGEQVKQERVAADAEIRELLGQEGYQYLDFRERSDPEREQVRSYQFQFADGGHALSKDQEEQLTMAMYDERQRFKFNIDYNDPTALDFSRIQDFFDEENINRFFVEMEELNQKVLARIQSLLTPEQIAVFEQFQQEHLERGRTTVRMTQSLFPTKKVARVP